MTLKIYLVGFCVGLVGMALSACVSSAPLPSKLAPQGAEPTPAPPDHARLFAEPHGAVWAAALAALAEQKIPMAVADAERGEIVSASVELDAAELARLSAAREALTRHGGRYVLQLRFERLAAQETRVVATLLLVAHQPWSMNPLGGLPLPSRGTLEREILESISEQL